MSEYQYYAFRSIDRSLTPGQMSELRSLSSRAIVTTNSFSNTYNYGNFRGDPRKLMEAYFDVHIYVSNFGTLTFMLRLPRITIPEDILARYASDDGLDWWATDAHTIIEWRLSGDPPNDWIEGEGWMDQLLPLREELVRADYRSLYIGWLASVRDEATEQEHFGDRSEVDEDASSRNRMEPPVPAGLGSLTEAQIALAEFLAVDGDLIAAAAEVSAEFPAGGASDYRVAAWVAGLQEEEIRALITRIIQGDVLRIQTQLQSRYYGARHDATESARSGASGRTAGDLVAMAAQTARNRARQLSVKRERERHAHLSGLGRI